MNATGEGPASDASDAARPTAATLTAGAVIDTTATLTIAGHTGDWWYKYTAPAGGSCSANAVSGASVDLRDLSSNTNYTFNAYGDSGCTKELASEDLLTRPGKPTGVTAAAGAGSGRLTLSASVSGSGALTNWQYRQKAATDADFGAWTDISSTSTTLSHTLSGLTDGTSYRFKVRAVNATGEGPASDASDAARPTAATLTAGAVIDTTATLTIAGHTGDWWYKYTAPAGGSCSANAVSGASVDLRDLSSNTNYTFNAYGDSGCTKELASEDLLTRPGKPTGVTAAAGAGSGRLTLSASVSGSGALTNWQYRQKAATDADFGAWTDISSTSTTLSHTLSGLADGTSYRFKVRAVNATGEGPASDASDAARPTAVTLTASAVKETTATLTVAGHAGSWWYKGNPSDARCTEGDANTATAALSGLTGGTSYVFKAYGDDSLRHRTDHRRHGRRVLDRRPNNRVDRAHRGDAHDRQLDRCVVVRGQPERGDVHLRRREHRDRDPERPDGGHELHLHGVRRRRLRLRRRDRGRGLRDPGGDRTLGAVEAGSDRGQDQRRVVLEPG